MALAVGFGKSPGLQGHHLQGTSWIPQMLQADGLLVPCPAVPQRAAHPVLPFQGCPHLPMIPRLSHSEATLPGSWGQTTGHGHGSPLPAWRPPCSATGRPHPGPATSLQGGALEDEVSPVSATQGTRGQRAPPRAVAGVPRKTFLPPVLTRPPPATQSWSRSLSRPLPHSCTEQEPLPSHLRLPLPHNPIPKAWSP